MNQEFDKAFFQRSWGKNGYIEYFSYGVGYKKVIELCIDQFASEDKTALEIGSGGGTFTGSLLSKFDHVTAIDVIRRPPQFEVYPEDSFTYLELPDQSFDCKGVASKSIDFCFSYNLFCHLSNDAIRQYLIGVNRVLVKGGDFIFMLSNFRHTSLHTKGEYNLGDRLPIGHFYQDLRTLDLVMDKDKWEVVSNNLLPEHRDIIVHLKKK